MAETLNQYKSNLTPEEVDQALHNIAQLDDGIAQAKQYAEQAQEYAESINPSQFVQMSALLNLVYPVGSIYMSANSTSPAYFLGGSWQRIMGRFLLGALEGKYTAGNTGGEETHSLSQEELPDYEIPKAALEGEIWNMAGQNASYPNGSCSGIVSRRPNSEGVGYATNSATAQDGFAIDASHTHNSGGGGQAHNNMPPYLVVYMWQRVS